MFLINEPLNDMATINDVDYPIDMSFNNVIDAVNIFKNPDLLDIDKIDTFIYYMTSNEKLLELPLEGKQELMSQIMEKINSEPTGAVEYDLEGNPMPQAKKNSEPEVISFVHDSKYIFSAFLQTYGIDLIEQQDNLHWIKFTALLGSLPDDTLMRQIIDIRKTDASKIKDKDEKKHILELKKQFSLTDTQILEEGDDGYGE